MKCPFPFLLSGLFIVGATLRVAYSLPDSFLRSNCPLLLPTATFQPPSRYPTPQPEQGRLAVCGTKRKRLTDNYSLRHRTATACERDARDRPDCWLQAWKERAGVNSLLSAELVIK
jgi:hypothetical protein